MNEGERDNQSPLEKASYEVSRIKAFAEAISLAYTFDSDGLSKETLFMLGSEIEFAANRAAKALEELQTNRRSLSQVG